MSQRRVKEPTRSGDEHDAKSGWKRMLCVFYNRTGLAARVKRALNKRLRRRAAREAREEAGATD